MITAAIGGSMAAAAMKQAVGGNGADPLDVLIPKLVDDPRYAEAAELLAVFVDRLRAIETERERINLQRHLAPRAPENDTSDHKILRAKLAKLDAAIVAAIPATPAAPGGTSSPAIREALDLLAGKPVPPPLDFAGRMVEADRQHDIIRAAVVEQNQVVDEIANELTLKYARQLRPAWDALVLEMYRSAQALARSTHRMNEFRARITAAGIKSRSDVLAMPAVRSPLILGSETTYDSEISGWRRILEQRGIL